MKSPQSESADLFQLLERWKQITLAEHEAILAETWPNLAQLQTEKTQLQSLIDRAYQTVLASGPASRQSLLSDQIKAVAAELMQLEDRNRQELAVKMAKTDHELKALNRVSQSLRHVHRAYGHADRSFWQAYS